MFEAFETLRRAMSELAAAVATGLEPEGWQHRDLGIGGAFTRPLANGVIATVGLGFASMSSKPWPAPLTLRFGAGYEPATALMPVVTLRWHFALVDEAAPEDGDEPLAITGPDSIAPVAERIVRLASQHALVFAEQYSSVADLDAALARTPASDLTVPDIQDRAVLLAASGQHAAARELIDTCVPKDLSERETQAYRRFVRQLGRWLDAGGPPIPPLEDSLRDMPELRTPPPPPSLAQSRQHSRDQRAAILAVRAKSAGKSRAELAELIATEFAARSLTPPTPFETAVAVDFLETVRGPFGKTRQRWRALRLTGKAVGDTVSTIRGRQGANPDWLQPPEDASYPARGDGGFAAVELSADAGAVLARACKEASRHIGPQILVDLWLSESGQESKPVTVHLGKHVIGTLPAATGAHFANHLRAASSHDEKVRVLGRLLAPSVESLPIVEIALPRIPEP